MTLPAAHAELHRTFAPDYAPNAFNPGRGKRTRFAPLKSAAGTVIPTLYAGQSIECAMYESILHDIPTHGDERVVAHSALLGRQYAALTASRELTLAQLFSPDLKQWRLERTQLIDTTAFHYRYTARWAEALHAAMPNIDGLVWASRQDDQHHAYVLFGDRVKSSDLLVLDGPREIVSDVALFNTLCACAAAMGAEVEEPDPPGVNA